MTLLVEHYEEMPHDEFIDYLMNLCDPVLICQTLAQIKGWERTEDMWCSPAWKLPNGRKMKKGDWFPIYDKEQSWDLMVEYNLSPMFHNEECFFITRRDIPPFHKCDLQKYIVVVALLIELERL